MRVYWRFPLESFMQPQSRVHAQPDVPALEWHDNHLRILDQRCLPERLVWVECHDAAEAAAAIAAGVVQGAVAAGLIAAYGIALAARQIGQADDWAAALEADFASLAQAQPSSAHLNWVLSVFGDRLRRLRSSESNVPELLAQTAIDLHVSDVEATRAMGRLGTQVIRRHDRQPKKILTMGNPGALGVVRAAHAAGLVEQLYLCAGAGIDATRLAFWELEQGGLPVSRHVAGAAGQLMKADSLHWVVAGAQRIAANGDVINDVGTYSLAVLAMHHGLRFMVVASSSAFDMTLENADGLDPDDALLSYEGQLSLDVTPAELIDVIVTERGVVERPDEGRIADLLSPQRLH